MHFTKGGDILKNIVSVKNVSKTYTVKKSKLEALCDITLEADENEILGIMGPSGCGKSTLLKIIAGIETATSGTLHMFGCDCTKSMKQDIKRKIGFIYQDNNLLPWRSVEYNLRFPLEIYGINKQEEYEERINEALEIVGLSDYRRALPQELSGGMMQRVNIARALVFNPDLILMDQPFGALDAITRKKLRFDFLKIFEKSHKTIIIATNSIDEALLFSNRIYIMSENPGTIQEIINVDVPFEERSADVASNKLFKDLRAHMIDITKKQYMKKDKNGTFKLGEVDN